ncbi:kinase-like protein [Gonapodya prolifera JEL478]|uniref:non-specific serine/threonine protein kinase n=1 Tax=Gonapodya prolifera (strain JEL478) TaxID=1344416 RepID=A0A139AY48_GONPJ|nr:kinase-like protein [Gonapodya prolifera JEL478]|eukprot:KXS21672.1 kinase-like protein [Gonapodya prolifera JEL478]
MNMNISALPPFPNGGLSASVDDEPEEAEDPSHRVVESDPTGRFDRYALSLGKGAYKEVFKALDNESGIEVAWNQLRIDHLTKRESVRFLSEIQLLQQLRHKNIINLYSYWTTKGPDGKERLCFITELMSSGTLKQYVKRTKGPVKPRVVRSWCRQVLEGLEYLHSRNPSIIHRDLKCDNIFINGNNGLAKIGDLGLAALKERDHLSSVLGTPEFMAPELYDEHYDEKVDIYAFGLCVLEMVTKEYPYGECTNQAQIFKRVTQGIKPQALSKVMDEATREFIDICINHDPTRRPSASDLLQHPFLQDEPEPPTRSSGSASSLQTAYEPSTSQSFSSLQRSTSNDLLPLSATDTFASGVASQDEVFAPKPHLHVSPVLSNHSSESKPTIIGATHPSETSRSTTATSDSSEGTPVTFSPEVGPSPSPSSSQYQRQFDTPSSSAFLIPSPQIGGQDATLSTIDAEFHTYHLRPHTATAPSIAVTSYDSVNQEMHIRFTYGKQEIKFPFSLKEDTAQAVVSEMVREGFVMEEDQQEVESALSDVVQEWTTKEAKAPGAVLNPRPINITGRLSPAIGQRGPLSELHPGKGAVVLDRSTSLGNRPQPRKVLDESSLKRSASAGSAAMVTPHGPTGFPKATPRPRSPSRDSLGRPLNLIPLAASHLSSNTNVPTEFELPPTTIPWEDSDHASSRLSHEIDRYEAVSSYDDLDDGEGEVPDSEIAALVEKQRKEQEEMERLHRVELERAMLARKLTPKGIGGIPGPAIEDSFEGLPRR